MISFLNQPLCLSGEWVSGAVCTKQTKASNLCNELPRPVSQKKVKRRAYPVHLLLRNESRLVLWEMIICEAASDTPYSWSASHLRPQRTAPPLSPSVCLPGCGAEVLPSGPSTGAPPSGEPVSLQPAESLGAAS